MAGRGLPVREIARLLHSSSARVRTVLAVQTEEMQRRNMEMVDSRRAVLASRLDFIQREALEAWEKSKQPVETTNEELSIERGPGAGEGAGPGPVLSSRQGKQTTRRGSTGNPEHLRNALAAIKQESDMLGLNAPKEIVVSERIEAEILGMANLFASMFDDAPKEIVEFVLPRMEEAMRRRTGSGREIIAVAAG